MSTSDKPQHETGTYNHNGDRNPASREDLPVEWWVRKYGLSEVEVRACRKAAAQMGRYRRWHREVRKRSRGSGETWDAASPDDVLLAHLPEAPSVLRQSQLAQVVFEIAVEMGVRTTAQQDRVAGTKYEAEDLLEHLRLLTRSLGHTPSAREIDEADGPSSRTYFRHFKNLREAQERAGLEPNDEGGYRAGFHPMANQEAA